MASAASILSDVQQLTVKNWSCSFGMGSGAPYYDTNCRFFSYSACPHLEMAQWCRGQE